ncbi:hypothetical protein [Streptacidiphilus rugosus]|uniref:hypothetical protein n=1 Tax=Streptacidiphilus rugosus TaxID=405783 RepID=UPI000564C294|nr:hypothetical protein [Streptacidiphilus rugosus]
MTATDPTTAPPCRPAGVTLFQETDFHGLSRHLSDTGLTAYSPAALGLARIASVVITPDGGPGSEAQVRVFRVQLYDRAPVYLPTGAEAREFRLDVTADLADTGDWRTRTRYVTVASCTAADADWGFGRPLAGGEPARYTLVDHPARPAPSRLEDGLEDG